MFYKKGGLKRGSPVLAATFQQGISQGKLAPGFPGGTSYVDLTVVNQTGNVYRVSTVTQPLQGTAITIRVTGESASRDQIGGAEEFGMNDGSSAEVWLGYETP